MLCKLFDPAKLLICNPEQATHPFVSKGNNFGSVSGLPTYRPNDTGSVNTTTLLRVIVEAMAFHCDLVQAGALLRLGCQLKGPHFGEPFLIPRNGEVSEKAGSGCRADWFLGPGADHSGPSESETALEGLS